jgi:glycosyltransferase involved in cell wall biosynthesis
VGAGPCLGELEGQARALGVHHRVTFTGKRQDVPQILRVCEIMVHPSLAEGIPLAVQEGMAAGLPLVGTNVDGTPEVVLHERTGLLVEVNDVPGLVQAMRRLLADPDLGRRLGAAGRHLIETKLSAARVTRQLEDVYQRVHGRFHARRQGRA